MRVNATQWAMARALLAHGDTLCIEAETQDEAVVRGRISDTEINSLASELKLDLSLSSTWETLERMTQWV